MQRGIQALGDASISPMGSPDGQNTLAVLALRRALSMIAATWRLVARRDRDQLDQ
jgi:hypothetical protein